MHKSIQSVIVCVLSIFVSGCLEFDEQTVYIEHDQANDRLILAFNYMGLFAAKDNGHSRAPAVEDMEESRRQLAEAMQLHKFALLDTWPLVLSVQEAREELERPEQDLPADLREHIDRILDEVVVQTAGFYTDAAGRLCAAQVVIINHASRTVPLINRAIDLAIRENIQEPGNPAERIGLERARNGQDWLRLNGHALEGVYPLPEEGLAEFRREFSDEAFELVGEIVEAAAEAVEEDTVEGQAGTNIRGRVTSLCSLVASPILVWHEDDLLRVRFGYCTMPSEIVALPALGDYRPNLEEHVAETYGLHLDANLARYLLEPEASAEAEGEQAARLMAPRLTPRQRARVLVHALESQPSDALWAKLRTEPKPDDLRGDVTGLPNDELLAAWKAWLTSRPVPRASD